MLLRSYLNIPATDIYILQKEILETLKISNIYSFIIQFEDIFSALQDI